MLDIAISLVCGTCVCVFGFWAFLKGQESMADIMRNGRPANLKSPTAIMKENRKEEQIQEQQQDYMQQLRSMFSDPAVKK